MSSIESIESAPATIPATSEATFNPALAPVSAGHRQVRIGQILQPSLLRQAEHRDQIGRRHQIRIVEHH